MTGSLNNLEDSMCVILTALLAIQVLVLGLLGSNVNTG